MQEITEIRVVSEIDKTFTAGVLTKQIPLVNFRTVDIVLTTGEGTEVNTNVQILGFSVVNPEGKPIPFYKRDEKCTEFERISAEGDKIIIGGEKGNAKTVIYRVSTAELAKEGLHRIALKTTKLDSWNGIYGCVMAVLYSPRYT